MTHGNVLAIDRIACTGTSRIGREMRDDLMAVQVEVDPVIGAPPFSTAEQAAIESARRRQIVDREGEMKGWKRHRSFVRARLNAVQTFGGRQ